MIVWKFASLFFLFGLTQSSSRGNVFDEEDLKFLADLYSRWSRAMHKFPETLWMFNSFPHLRPKPRFNDLFPDHPYWPDIKTDSIDDGDFFDKKTSSFEDSSNSEVRDSTTTELTDSNSSITIDSRILITHEKNESYDSSTDETDGLGSEFSFEQNSTVTSNQTDDIVITDDEFWENATDALVKEFGEFLRNRTNQCNHDLLYVVFNLYKHWVIEMLDSAGKPASGILRGNLHWLGDYRQCKNVSVAPVTLNGMHFGGFNGEYCYASWDISLEPKLTVPLGTGICAPDSCSAEDLIEDNEAIKLFFGKIPIVKKITSRIQLTNVNCPDRNRSWKAGGIAYMCILAIFAVLIIAGTTCDLIKNNNSQNFKKEGTNSEGERKNSKAREFNQGNHTLDIPDVAIANEGTAIAVGKERMYGDDVPLSIQRIPKHEKSGWIIDFLICFSVYSNASKVLSVGNQQGQLSCLHGIRFLSLSWVIFGHVFVYALSSVGNVVDALEDIDSFSFQVVSQATLSVDSFFLLSGLLLSYLYFKECEKRAGKTNWIYYYVHRIWRLTPAFAMLLGFFTTLWLHLGSGPLWPAETDNGNCRKSWWWNLLYIVNFHDVNENCMGWTWYLANDMQFYIISPVFLILLWKLPLVGVIVVSVVMVASWILTGVLSAVNDLNLFMSLTENMQLSDVVTVEKKQWDFFNIVYDKPYCRIGPYLIGLLLGYALYRINGRQKFMKTWMLVVGWMVAAFFGVSVVFGLYHVEMGRITAAFYNALSRSVWSMALGWVIFVCLTGHAGPVNKLLSWNFWIPLSRLTYCAYLIHPMIMVWYYSSLQKMLHFQMNTMVLFYFGYLVFAYLAGFVASMAFESPMMALEKFILKRFSKR